MKEAIDMLLKISDRTVDPIAKDMIRKWSDPPTAAQVLETLDACVHGSLTSSFEIKVLDMLLKYACKREGTTPEDVAKGATWRVNYQ